MHGAGGTLGALLTGVFASAAINPMFKDAQGHILPVGMIDGNYRQLGNQAVGVSIAIVLAVVGTSSSCGWSTSSSASASRQKTKSRVWT